MNGQWLGRYEGSQSGLVFMNFDDLGPNYGGTAFLLPDDGQQNVPVRAFLRTPSKAAEQSFRTDLIQPISRETRMPSTWEDVKRLYPNTAFSQYADVTLKLDGRKLHAKWTTDIAVEGHSVLEQAEADLPSKLTPVSDVTDWPSFKAFVGALEIRRFIYRGQTYPFRLRTTYHRTGRADLYRYMQQDIPMLHRHLSARTRHFYQLADPNQTGAFYSLIQHHGYPTPLLDWTYSPYVAAFFAYRHLPVSQVKPDHKVRIHCFDYHEWRADWETHLFIDTPVLHFSVAEFLAIENDRMIPQQSVSSVTNVDDVEGYIEHRGKQREKIYLRAFDLPASDRSTVMRELSSMGITAGSLFPGLDGACEELKERYFAT